MRLVAAPTFAVIRGDGIGTEVVSEALKVMSATGADFNLIEFDLGGERYLRDGVVLTDADFERISSTDAILLGAVGTPLVPSGILEQGLLLRLRFGLDLAVNYRPLRGPGGSFADGPVVVRENSEGLYAGEGGFLRKGTPHEIATQGSVNTWRGVERCVRFAFELAASRPRRRVTMVHKTNVLPFAGDLWSRVFWAVAAEFPHVFAEYHHADAACMYLVQAPERYDVIVTDNLFGDLLSDLAAAVCGGIGLAASANLNLARTGPSLFEPVHGSAPDIAGTGRANPIAAITTAMLMFEFVGLAHESAWIEESTREYLGMDGSTKEVGDAIAARVMQRRSQTVSR
jgi:3-isopropylmalate dehydrogenase